WGNSRRQRGASAWVHGPLASGVTEVWGRRKRLQGAYYMRTKKERIDLLSVKSEDGCIGGYESHAGLIREFAKASIPVGEFLGPEDFDKERSGTPETTSQLDELTSCVSPPSQTPGLHGASSTDLSDTPSSSNTSTTASSLSTAPPQQSSIDVDWSTKEPPRKTFRSRPPLKSHRALQSRPVSTQLRLALMSFLDSCLA
ncbi:hypothetical protein BHE90_017053, partial [Fusarium euwallaceae]